MQTVCFDLVFRRLFKSITVQQRTNIYDVTTADSRAALQTTIFTLTSAAKQETRFCLFSPDSPHDSLLNNKQLVKCSNSFPESPGSSQAARKQATACLQL